MSAVRYIFNTHGTYVAYVKNNRAKHNLPANSNKGFKPLVESISCEYNYSFREEYSGGFDVIIGNPPYVRSRELFNDNEKKYFLENYETTSYQLDLYKLFINFYTKRYNIRNLRV